MKKQRPGIIDTDEIISVRATAQLVELLREVRLANGLASRGQVLREALRRGLQSMKENAPKEWKRG